MASPSSSGFLLILDVVPVVASKAASLVLLFLAIQHLGKAISRRLWLFPCYPVKFLAINAATLGLLSIAAYKPAKMLITSGEEVFSGFYNLLGSVLVCALIGSCMPSLATTNLSDMWSNTAGAGLLLITLIFNILIYEESIYEESKGDSSSVSLPSVSPPYIIVASCMIALLLVLLTQGLALEAMMADVGACVSIQLKKLQMETRQDVDAGVIKRAWSWEALEHNACIMLMMVLTSNPQNVASRSPTVAIVGALVSSSIISSWTKLNMALVFSPIIPSWIEIKARYMTVALVYIVPAPMLVICLWRWLRVAFHDDRPVGALVCAAEPSYWRRKVNTFWLRLKAGPLRLQGQPMSNIWEQVQYVFKALLYSIGAFIMLCFIIPIHWLLVACIRFTHIVSSLLLRMSICLPLKLIQLLISWFLKWNIPRCDPMKVQAISAETEHALGAGVICLAGEDPRVVWREFQGVAKLIIRRQARKAESKTDLKALESLVRWSDRACFFDNSAVLDVLDQRGAPSVNMLPYVGHAGEYGWSLTAISLLVVMSEIEEEALGTHETFKAAMEAYKQALEMVKVVDEMYPPIMCSKETYLDAAASLWVKLLKPKKCRSLQRRSMFASPLDILEALLESATNHIEEYNNTCTVQVVAAWPVDVVVSYTMYTMCQNLRRWWTAPRGSHSSKAEAMVAHLNYLMAEVLAGCLSNLPGALDMTMNEAVRKGDIAKIETGILLIRQGQGLWEKLQWPALRGPTNTLGGQLNQWLQASGPDVSQSSNIIKHLASLNDSFLVLMDSHLETSCNLGFAV